MIAYQSWIGNRCGVTTWVTTSIGTENFDNSFGVTTCPVYVKVSAHSWGNYRQQETPVEEFSRKARELLQKRDISRTALRRAQMALQRALDDPGGQVPLQDRKRPYVRPRSKKRVCAGSSRYRVLVN
jgi:hypothetical protein